MMSERLQAWVSRWEIEAVERKKAAEVAKAAERKEVA